MSTRCPSCRRSFRPGYVYCPLDGAVLDADAADPMLGATVAGRYAIESLIGTGNFGRVYQARHTRMSRRFAVKVLRDEAARDGKHRRRFLREAEAASRLDHPNVVAVIDVGETEAGVPYLVMELAAGEPLAAIVARDGPLPAARAGGLARQLADGLAHAHDHGVVHRDLKPANVIVERDGEGERARIADFGLAIADPFGSGDRITTVGMVVGTPAYLAPEQASGGPVDHRGDLYALGVVLHELLAGGPPFTGSALEVITHHRETAPPRIAGPEVDPLLEALSRWLMEKRPEARPQHAAHVLELLDTLADDPERAAQRLEPWIDPGARLLWKRLDDTSTQRF